MVGFFTITFLLYLQCFNKDNNGQCYRKLRNISSPLSSPFFLYQERQRNWFLTFLSRGWWLLLHWDIAQYSFMGTKMKGIYKYISNIFVVKEREIEIGYPTDVKHVAHIGWDGPSGNAPSWMNQFKKGPDFAAASIGNSGSTLSPWSSQGVGESNRGQSAPETYKDSPPNKEVVHTKKQKRRKSKATSSPNSSSSSSSKSSRAVKSKAKFVEGTARPANIEVA